MTLEPFNNSGKFPRFLAYLEPRPSIFPRLSCVASPPLDGTNETGTQVKDRIQIRRTYRATLLRLPGEIDRNLKNLVRLGKSRLIVILENTFKQSRSDIFVIMLLGKKLHI